MNPEQKISIALSVANNTIDTMSATFNGKAITVKEGTTEVTVKDYLANGKTGVLTVTAANSLGTTTKSMTITADDSVSYGMKLYIEKNQTVYAWSTATGAVETLMLAFEDRATIIALFLTAFNDASFKKSRLSTKIENVKRKIDKETFKKIELRLKEYSVY